MFRNTLLEGNVSAVEWGEEVRKWRGGEWRGWKGEREEERKLRSEEDGSERVKRRGWKGEREEERRLRSEEERVEGREGRGEEVKEWRGKEWRKEEVRKWKGWEERRGGSGQWLLFAPNIYSTGSAVSQSMCIALAYMKLFLDLLRLVCRNIYFHNTYTVYKYLYNSFTKIYTYNVVPHWVNSF